MKIPPSMPKMMTHRLIRSKVGTNRVANLLEMFPGFEELDGRVATRCTSIDRLFIFVVPAENNAGVGAVRAKDLKHLLRTIEELFETHLLPPANCAPIYNFELYSFYENV